MVTNNSLNNAGALLINAMLYTDGYKLGHKTMYPEGKIGRGVV